MHVFLNGRWVCGRDARISVFDHGFLYGDGVYETVRVYGGAVFRWPAHDRRLRRACAAIGLSCPWSSVSLKDAAVRAARGTRRREASVRITVSRGRGTLGLHPANCRKPTLAVMAHPGRALAGIRRTGVTIAISRHRRHPPAGLERQIKSISALPQVLAAAEARRWRAFEAVMLNAAGELTEGTAANLFWVKHREIRTPDLSCGVLDGIIRQVVLRLARREGLSVREGRYGLSDLRAADEAFLTSSTLEIVPVVKVVEGRRGRGKKAGTRRRPVADGRPGPLTRRLQRILRGEIRRECRMV